MHLIPLSNNKTTKPSIDKSRITRQNHALKTSTKPAYSPRSKTQQLSKPVNGCTVLRSRDKLNVAALAYIQTNYKELHFQPQHQASQISSEPILSNTDPKVQSHHQQKTILQCSG
ncbi:hypothetical protein NPIL_190331 [Nephila pilipes]|uniref:Uncharacterized protein n=1 Tax=Nephila pilipes TaxID=299642 RepID=A0A8X6PBT8_NEPPI|nr:hypothetical protein NPIL_190331 [Nephila pilipes]